MLAASYAKINLFLEVTGKLANNYHQVNTVFSSIDLCDYISYNTTDKPEIAIDSSDSSLAGKANLMFRVAEFLQQHYCRDKGVKINLEKHIPVAAGLGGGSSNAANSIIALNELWQLELGKSTLHEIAASFGSDLNFFLEGGTAQGSNRGEQIQPLPNIKIDRILLVNPKIPILSSEAYRLMTIPDNSELRRFDPRDLGGTCFNRLELGIRLAYNQIDQLIRTIKSYGASVAMLSGSGSTCFGFFDDQEALLACKAYFVDRGYWTRETRTIFPQA